MTPKLVLQKICDIIQHDLRLEEGFVYIFKQKIFEPQTSGLFVVVGMHEPRVWASKSVAIGDAETQTVNINAMLTIDMISKDTSALERFPEVIAALGGQYARQIQEKFAFHVGRLPPNPVVDLSSIDGGAIPYRYQAAPRVQFVSEFTRVAEYFENFQTTALTTEE